MIDSPNIQRPWRYNVLTPVKLAYVAIFTLFGAFFVDGAESGYSKGDVGVSKSKVKFVWDAHGADPVTLRT